MAGDKVNNYSQVDSDILALQLTTDRTFKGYHQLTLTEYDTTTVPAIAAGSAIECNGALYKFDSEEAISTTDPVTSAAVADGTVYVCIIPGATTCTAAFTATAPTWSDTKNGWYGTGGQANYRYAEYAIYKSTASYSKGSFDIFKKSCVSVTNSAVQSVSATGLTKIIFDTKICDARNEFDSVINYRFTSKNIGYYLISGEIVVMGIAGNFTGSLYKNGSSAHASGKILFSSSSAGIFDFSYLIYLNSTDYLEIFIDSISDDSYRIGNITTHLNIIQVS